MQGALSKGPIPHWSPTLPHFSVDELAVDDTTDYGGSNVGAVELGMQSGHVSFSLPTVAPPNIQPVASPSITSLHNATARSH